MSGIRLKQEDLERISKIMNRHEVLKNNSQVIRHSLEFTDRWDIPIIRKLLEDTTV